MIAASELTCHHQLDSCSGRVSCQCQEAIGLLVWTVSSPAAGGTVLCTERYQISSRVMEGEVSFPCPGLDFMAVLDSRVVGDADILFISSLNLTLTESVVVKCTDATSRAQNITIQLASEYV